MKAIVTKYHGPTNHKGSRITASDEDGNRVTISYPHELSGEDCHRAAADALCKKMGWDGELIGGSLKRGYVFVFSPCRINGYCTCDQRSWYGDEHDTACEMTGRR